MPLEGIGAQGGTPARRRLGRPGLHTAPQKRGITRMACAANSFAGRIVAERRARHRASSISDAIIGRLARLSVVHQSESTMISSGQIPLRGALALVAFLAFLSLPAHAQLKIGISGPLEGKNAG